MNTASSTANGPAESVCCSTNSVKRVDSDKPYIEVAPRLGFAATAFRVLTHGPLFSLVERQSLQTEPLDSEETWRFWNTPYPKPIEILLRNYPSENGRRKRIEEYQQRPHSTGIEEHYDISNRFFQLFLDSKYLYYTCAKYESPGDTLEDAQTRKAEFLMDLLEPQLGENILDIGCGWGSNIRALQERIGATTHLTALTLSPAQERYIRERFDFQVDLVNAIEDPFPDSPYDKVISTGFLEHVRPAEVRAFFKKVHEETVKDAVFVLQYFSLERERYPVSTLMAQNFFPGSMLSLQKDIVAYIQDAGWKIVTDDHDDYQRTLRAWFDNIVANYQEAIKLVGVQTYNRYLVYLAASHRFFKDKESVLHRIKLVKGT